MIKNIWCKIAYYWFIGMLIIIGLLTGDLVKADTISVSGAQYNVYVDTNVSNGCLGEGEGYKNLDTVSNLTSYNGSVSVVAGVSRVDYVANATLQNGTQYSVDVVMSFNPKNIINYNSWTYSMEGSTTTSNSGLSANNITSYTCYAENVTNDNYQVKIHCDFIPKYTLARFYLRVNTQCGSTSVNYFNTYTMRVNSITSTENAINSQTTIIQNEFNETNQTINDMGDNIINNQNQNTQDIIDSNKVCTFYDKNSIIKTNTQINANGNEDVAEGFGVTDFIKINSSSSLEVVSSFSSQKYACFYDINKTKISCIQLNSFSGDITIPSNASYLRATIYISANKPTFRICTNGNQALNDTLEDDSVEDPSDMLEDFEDLLPSNGVITQLIALPISWYSKILDSLSGTCASFNLGSLYGTSLIMPCIDLTEYLGSTLVNTIDLMISGFFIIHIAKKMIKAFENFTSMKEGDVIND